MNVARLVQIGAPLQVGTAEVPTVGPREVLVSVASVGLVPNARNVATGKTPFILPTLPAIFGFDASGTITAVGEHVLNHEVGQKVYVNPHLTCGTCDECRRGQSGLCPFGCLRGYFAQTEQAARLMNQHPIGALAEQLPASDGAIIPLPADFDLDLAARFGYLGTSFAGLKTGKIGPGRTVLINGVTGTLGVAAVAIALGLGATKILGIGRNRQRLEQVAALAPGRVHTISSEDTSQAAELVTWVKDHTDGRGVDALYDCLGVGGDAGSTSALLDAVRGGGVAALAAGGAEGDLTQSYAQAMSRNVAVVGTGWANTAQFTEMADLITAGVIDLSILTHRHFGLSQVNQAFEFVGDRPGGFVNVVVHPGQDHVAEDGADETGASQVA